MVVESVFTEWSVGRVVVGAFAGAYLGGGLLGHAPLWVARIVYLA